MLLLWLVICSLLPRADSQEPGNVNAVCSAEACYTAHLQRKSFSDAWRSCRDHGGNLASIKRREEAALVEELLQGLLAGDGHGHGHGHGHLKLWLGLHRQPRQCSPYKPLRGFTWTTGDQETRYTNWLKDEHPGSCPAARCVVLSYGTGRAARDTDYKWLDGSCLLAVDGYLCRFAFKGMCGRIELASGRPVAYATPFGVTSAQLQHVPFGSVATLPCDGTRGAQSLLCMTREEEKEERRGGARAVGWSQDPPYCQESRRRSWCADNGGCQHTCVDEGAYYHCRCDEGYQLDEDGRACTLLDDCASNPCQFYCAGQPGGFVCSCPSGYRLADNGRDCLDVDECPLAFCSQSCLNTPGTFFCQCFEGYQLEEGECRDQDECEATPCDQLCANTEGSYQCYCEVGFTLVEDDARSCIDVDECQYQGTCEQMCVNYLGHFECHCEEGYALDLDGFSCNPAPDPYGRPTSGGFAKDFETWLTEVPSWGAVPPVQESETEAGVPRWRAKDTDPAATLPVPEVDGHAGIPERTPPSDSRPAPTEAEPEREGHSTVRAENLSGNLTALERSLTSAAGATERPTPVTQPWEARNASGTHGGVETQDQVPTAEAEEQRQAAKTTNPGWREQEVEEQTPVWKLRGLPVQEVPLTTTTAANAMVRFRLAQTEGQETLELARTSSALERWPALNASSGPDAHRELQQRRDDRWLIIALLVPICVFVVVMLALAIVYCTRCACGRSRNITDCYRWMNNNTKSAVPDPAATNMNTTV